MSVVATVMTGPGLGAIATVQLCGDAAQEILRKVFRRKGDRPCALNESQILLGRIVDEGESVDEVTLGCEGTGTFAIHCHGNPLIVARIIEVLRKEGVQVVPPEQLLARILTNQKADDAVGIEAKRALATVKTIAGAAIVANQVPGGLSERIRRWLDRLDSMPLEEIAAEAGDILKRSESARLIISGCTIALVGPPNTGKSTLLNTLAGREKSIVSDTRGTTRDWVSAEIHIPPLAATIIDTAGLDPSIGTPGGVDQAAQQKSMEIIKRADLVLLILDLSRSAEPLSETVAEQLIGKKVVTVLNKADLPSRLDLTAVPDLWGPPVRISARRGTGIDDLVRAIHRVCNVVGFDPRAPVAFMDRQRYLLEALRDSDSKARTRSILSELVESPSL